MKKFCDNCLKNVNCKYNEKNVEIEIDNKKIEYLKKYYICDECKNEFLDDLFDYDIETVNNKLRESNDIITTTEIEEILTKYDIGKKPLATILGVGEINIIRYLNGSNPTREISDLLKNILNNPFLYELFLESAKDRISEIAYKKSLGKTKQLELTDSNSKLYNITLYIVKELDEVDTLSVQKILYFVSGLSRKFLKNNIFNDLPEAWKHGPVYREIYNSLSYYKKDKINFEELLKNKDFNLTEEEKKYIDVIIKDFGCYSGSTLRKMTHLTEPWIKARVGLDDNESSNRIIERKDINNYFDNICEKYNINELKDISKYSYNLFKESQK